MKSKKKRIRRIRAADPSNPSERKPPPAEAVSGEAAPNRREVPYPESALGGVRYRTRGKRPSRWRSLDNSS